MKFLTALALPLAVALAAPSAEKRAEAGFDKGEPESADGKGGPIIGEYTNFERIHKESDFLTL